MGAQFPARPLPAMPATPPSAGPPAGGGQRNTRQRTQARTDDTGKMGQEEANYIDMAPAHAAGTCGECAHFLGDPSAPTTGGCDIVSGDIAAEGTCDYFEPGGEPPPMQGAELETEPVVPMPPGQAMF